MNRIKLLHKILANQIQKYSKQVIHHDQVGLVSRMQDWFNIWLCHNIVVYHINRIKGKNDMRISVDTENTSDKTQHPSTIKVLEKIRIEGNFLKPVKSILKNLQLNHTQRWRTECFLPSIRKKSMMSVVPSI